MASDRPYDKSPDDSQSAEATIDAGRIDAPDAVEPAPSQLGGDAPQQADARPDSTGQVGAPDAANQADAVEPAPSQLEQYTANASTTTDAEGSAAPTRERTPGAQDAPDRRLAEARDARDALADEVRYRPKPAAVCGGYNAETGAVAAGMSGPEGCAEDDVVRQLGGDGSKVKFTEATRPRNGEPVDVCVRCQDSYDQSQFPDGTGFEADGRWSRT